jgi:hypothetical protein
VPSVQSFAVGDREAAGRVKQGRRFGSLPLATIVRLVAGDAPKTSSFQRTAGFGDDSRRRQGIFGGMA